MNMFLTISVILGLSLLAVKAWGTFADWYNKRRSKRVHDAYNQIYEIIERNRRNHIDKKNFDAVARLSEIQNNLDTFMSSNFDDLVDPN